MPNCSLLGKRSESPRTEQLYVIQHRKRFPFLISELQNDCGAIGSVTPLYTLDPSTTTRSYAATGYLETNLLLKNLFVLTNAQVTKVIALLALMECDVKIIIQINFEAGGTLQRAVSVDVVSNGTKFCISKIQRDVILSSGIVSFL